MRRFLVDNQLPAALTRWLRDKGQEAEHVLDLNTRYADLATGGRTWRCDCHEGRRFCAIDDSSTRHRGRRLASGRELSHLRLAGKFRAPMARNSPTVRDGGATNRGLLILLTLPDYWVPQENRGQENPTLDTVRAVGHFSHPLIAQKS